MRQSIPVDQVVCRRQPQTLLGPLEYFVTRILFFSFVKNLNFKKDPECLALNIEK